MMTRQYSGSTHYYSLSDYCKETYGEKIYKIAINAGLSCPNRDGAIDTRGCIFCSAGGSGDFAVPGSLSIRQQIEQGRLLLSAKHTGSRFIAYFQAYTNTYGKPQHLLSMYEEALSQPDIAGISIATRPDCLGAEILTVLHTCQEHFPGKSIWIELGLQTIHERAATYIRRGYTLPIFEHAMQELSALSIPVIVHVILGLPGETAADMYETVCYQNRYQPFGIKLQLLHVLSGTDLATDYEAGKFQTLSEAEYLEILCHCIELLSPETVIHRLTGDGPKKLLLAPLWSANKKEVLNAFQKKLSLSNCYQGSCYHE